MNIDQGRETNIGPNEKRRRAVTGTLLVGAGLVLVAAQMLFEWHRAWRLLAMLPFILGTMGLLQAHSGT